jgi:hypothetical protein
MQVWERGDGKWVIREFVSGEISGQITYRFVVRIGTSDQRWVDTPDEATAFETQQDAQDFIDQWPSGFPSFGS